MEKFIKLFLWFTLIAVVDNRVVGDGDGDGVLEVDDDIVTRVVAVELVVVVVVDDFVVTVVVVERLKVQLP